MSEDEILEVMEESEDHSVKVVDEKGQVFEGIVDLYESRYDNEDDDEPYAGEASISMECDDGSLVTLYESDISSIELLD